MLQARHIRDEAKKEHVKAMGRLTYYEKFYKDKKHHKDKFDLTKFDFCLRAPYERAADVFHMVKARWSERSM